MQALKAVGYDRAECPACGKDCSVRSHRPELSGLWGHYFGKKCRAFRANSENTYPDHTEISLLIKQADNLGRKRFKAAQNEQKAREISEKREAHERVHRKHHVTGGFLLDVISELQGALDMMEPYYSQCDAGNSGFEMIARLEQIVAQKPTNLK